MGWSAAAVLGGSVSVDGASRSVGYIEIQLVRRACCRCVVASGVSVSSWRFSLAPAGYRSFANFPAVEKPLSRSPPAGRASGFACNTPDRALHRACRQSGALVGAQDSSAPTALLLKLRAIARYCTGNTPYPAGLEVHVAWQRNLRRLSGAMPHLASLSGTTFVSDKLAIAARLLSVRTPALTPPTHSRTTSASQLT